MNTEDKATTTIPDSPAQETLRKIDNRDKVLKTAQLAIFFVVAIFNVFIILRLQQVIDQNQRESLARSGVAVQDRKEQKDYIKCVLLIRYDASQEALSTRAGVEAALDRCAKVKP